jgi:hypothetical protein
LGERGLFNVRIGISPVLCRRHQRWAGSILRKLIAYRDGRNAALMRATFDFRSIIARGLIAEAAARSLLVMACSANGYLGKVGIGQVNATISWALEPLEKRRREMLGRNASYEAARRGDIPTIRIGRLLQVPVVALERKLEEAGR